MPSATEIIADLGLVDSLVGVSDECRWPPEVVGKPVVTAARDSTRLALTQPRRSTSAVREVGAATDGRSTPSTPS